MTIEEAKKNIGKTVKYIPYIGCPKNKIEHGYIKDVNDTFVFVCFGARTMSEQKTRTLQTSNLFYP